MCNFLCSVTGQRTVTVSLPPKATDLSEIYALLGFYALKNGTVYSRIQSASFLQFQRVKKSDADLICGRELDFGKLIEPLYVP